MIQATAAVIIRDGKILITKEKSGICAKEKWGFPGGKVEPDETMAQCVVRQLALTLNLQVRIESFICASHYNDSYGDIELFAYQVSLLSQEPIPQEDADVTWVLPSEIPLLDFTEAYLPVCQRIMEDYHD